MGNSGQSDCSCARSTISAFHNVSIAGCKSQLSANSKCPKTFKASPETTKEFLHDGLGYATDHTTEIDRSAGRH